MTAQEIAHLLIASPNLHEKLAGILIANNALREEFTKLAKMTLLPWDTEATKNTAKVLFFRKNLVGEKVANNCESVRHLRMADESLKQQGYTLLGDDYSI